MTPGLSVMRSSKLRPLSGRSFTSRSPTSPETEDVVVLTTEVASVTFTTWARSPTSSRSFTTASCPTARLIPLRTSVRNPGFSALTSYGPMGSESVRKDPDSSETAVRVAPVSRFFTVTAEALMAAPEGSSTFPEMAAVTWPKAGNERMAKVRDVKRAGHVHANIVSSPRHPLLVAM